MFPRPKHSRKDLVTAQRTMDTSLRNEQQRHSGTNPKPENLEVCWRVLEGSSTRILTCWIVVSPPAMELQVGYVVDAPLHSQAVADIESAQALAQAWLDAVRTKSAKSDKR